MVEGGGIDLMGIVMHSLVRTLAFILSCYICTFSFQKGPTVCDTYIVCLEYKLEVMSEM